VPAADTNRVYSFVEIASDPGDGTPLHVHENEDEYLFVLEGTARCMLGDKIFDAEAGTMVELPKRISHAWGNRSTSILRMAFVIPAARRRRCASLPKAALRTFPRWPRDSVSPSLAPRHFEFADAASDTVQTTSFFEISPWF
jgi:uncharacterized cupin superfamily protein